eukprot:1999203-Pyramimonas_sp.AAC.1
MNCASRSRQDRRGETAQMHVDIVALLAPGTAATSHASGHQHAKEYRGRATVPARGCTKIQGANLSRRRDIW